MQWQNDKSHFETLMLKRLQPLTGVPWLYMPPSAELVLRSRVSTFTGETHNIEATP